MMSSIRFDSMAHLQNMVCPVVNAKDTQINGLCQDLRSALAYIAELMALSNCECNKATSKLFFDTLITVGHVLNVMQCVQDEIEAQVSEPE